MVAIDYPGRGVIYSYTNAYYYRTEIATIATNSQREIGMNVQRQWGTLVATDIAPTLGFLPIPSRQRRLLQRGRPC